MKKDEEDKIPISWMTLAYAILSEMILAISGKCQPYHSFERKLSFMSHQICSRETDLYSHSIDIDFFVKIIK